MADESRDILAYGNFCAFDEFDIGNDLSMDLDTNVNIVEEFSLQNRQVEVTLENILQEGPAPDAVIRQNSEPQTGFQVLEGQSSLEAESANPVTYPSYNSEVPDSRKGCLDVPFDYAGNRPMVVNCGRQGPSSQFPSPMHTCSGNNGNWYPQVSVGDTSCNERGGVSPLELPSCSRVCSFAVGGANLALEHTNNLDGGLLKDRTGTVTQFSPLEGNIHFKYPLQTPATENMDLKLRSIGSFATDSMETLGAFESNQCTYVDIPFGVADVSDQDAASIESTIFHNSNVVGELSDSSSTGLCMNGDAKLFPDPSFNLLPKNPYLHFSEEMISEKKDKMDELRDWSAWSSRKMSFTASGERIGRYFSDMSRIDNSDFKKQNIKYYRSNNISPTIGSSFPIGDEISMDGKPLISTLSYMSRKTQAICLKDERKDGLVGSGIMHNSVGPIDEAISRKCSYGTDEKFSVEKEFACKRARDSSTSEIDGGYLNLNATDEYLTIKKPCTSAEKQMGCIQNESEGKHILFNSMGYDLSKVSSESIHSHSSDTRSFADNDSDLCILENSSQSSGSNQAIVLGKSLVTTEYSTSSDPLHYGGLRCTRKANDERLIYQVALQDLSQPSSEASVPDDLLAVPLLRHQRIDMSWMVQKETSSLHCSGGILADDQGLGKTISTIALILKERPPLRRSCQENVEERELETLNLDEDTEVVLELDGMKENADFCQFMSNESPMKTRKASVQAKGRPAAGTLVVCPTSVLRQWADELHSKVSSKANISVLVYHGSSRTKDPRELAKYDVVLTTYSIVSMEVPKQPLLDKDNGEKINLEFSASGKSRYSSSSDKKCSKDKKVMDNASLDSVARPLARVAWFRVVLDEAQSIKNHRTQVARACWGLHAKRRWCLSGTPIQNAVDDLYSYFRFLRYDPYSIYNFFCDTIKVPISKSPSKGYRKLQAVLKTIMLRRTKGTLLDGKPIITLPPKVVELKKVDFSKEERDFYTKLEADSRTQFEEYAAAGTVKQNYVNILLMLLRLRQACDHPLLVKGIDSNYVFRSTIEVANKLSREKKLCLLSCLEASLAICGICNDLPEDAVVSLCGHIFCNQCICEHLTSDDIQCPATNCKVPLNESSVFSKATLHSSLSNNPDLANSELVEEVKPFYDVNSQYSSKIKAALEVLQSLAKRQDCISRNSSVLNSFDGPKNCAESSLDPCAGESLVDIPDGTNNMNGNQRLTDSSNTAREKAIVFSQWTKMLDLLEDCLLKCSINYRRLDGTMSVVARDKAVKDFNTLPEVSVVIMSLKAASLGLNMVAASHVLLLDLWWNPTTEDQAIDRAHRIGQTRPVKVLRVTVKDTVEDRILSLQQKKREMVSSAFGEDETGSRQSRLTVEDLKYLFMV